MDKYICLHSIKKVAEEIKSLEADCALLKSISARKIQDKLKELRATLEILTNDILKITIQEVEDEK
ncbi:hypothetical protein A2V80_00850 [Candidatus Woesebacteria bacterium RBG_16_39_8b]|uniref:Uncharacterized protein n=1 Tax=Candidatus Woesebacteria bacterium RBG_16_39_8b TaxID=1802482 RepID=A0A1F7XCM7_9BACT|nr:MAG: hypothetical protein A2V80_00850 [Candidatus Woesebacteria bacterium RBG_16_39_8b]